MPEFVFGLPVHPLVVHATVVIVPWTALVLLLAVLVPRFRVWAGWMPLGLAVLSPLLALSSTASGENLQRRLGSSRLLAEHAALGEMLIWWCLGMLVVAVALMVLTRRRGADQTATAAGGPGHDAPRGPTKGWMIALVVAGATVSVGSLVQVALIGHSGAESAWGGVVPAGSQE